MQMPLLQKTNVKDIFEKAIRSTNLEIQRETVLQEIANKIAKTINKKETANINFVCNYNSRRSQLAQVWACYAMEYFNLTNINSFSSGATQTTFHPNTLKTLESCGFKFVIEEFNHKNPKYLISYNGCSKEISVFSKSLDHPINKTPFIAIITSDNIDKNESVFLEALSYFYLPYIDLKIHDDENNQTEFYLNTSRLIAGEMGVLFKKVKEQLI